VSGRARAARSVGGGPWPARADGAARLLRLLAERLEAYLDGDELAFETVGESIEELEPSADDLETAILALRGAAAASEADAPGMSDEPAPGTAPGRQAQRVWSREERESLSPAAWGFLIDLRRRGSLDGGQFERVLEVLTGCGVRPVEVDLAREVAARVALEGDTGGGPEGTHGEADQTH
jgi:uncharacterized protein Smg (DUF494 family)